MIGIGRTQTTLRSQRGTTTSKSPTDPHSSAGGLGSIQGGYSTPWSPKWFRSVFPFQKLILSGQRARRDPDLVSSPIGYCTGRGINSSADGEMRGDRDARLPKLRLDDISNKLGLHGPDQAWFEIFRRGP